MLMWYALVCEYKVTDEFEVLRFKATFVSSLKSVNYVDNTVLSLDQLRAWILIGIEPRRVFI